MIPEDIEFDEIPVYAIAVEFHDKTSRLFTFSCQEAQEDYAEYLQHNADELGAKSMMLSVSMLDFTLKDYEEYYVVH